MPDIGPSTVVMSRTDSANTQRWPVSASDAASRAMPPTFWTIVVVPERRPSIAASVDMTVASSDDKRLDGLSSNTRLLGKP